MKKRMMAVYALIGALAVSPALTSCVDDDSTTIEAHRNSEVEQLKALASLNMLKGEAEKIEAESEAALKKAEAAYLQQCADKTQAELEQHKLVFELQIEDLKQKNKQELADLEYEMLLMQQDIQKMADKRLKNLYETVMEANLELLDLQEAKMGAEHELLMVKNEMATEHELIPGKIAHLEKENLQIQTRIDFLKKYEKYDRNELERLITASYKKVMNVRFENAVAYGELIKTAKQLSDMVEVTTFDSENDLDEVSRFSFIDSQLKNIMKYHPEKLTAVQKAYLDFSEKYKFEYVITDDSYHSKKEEVLVRLDEDDEFNLTHLFNLDIKHFSNIYHSPRYMLIEAHEEGFKEANDFLDIQIESIKSEVGEPASEDKSATGYHALLASAEEALKQAIEDEATEEDLKFLKDACETAKRNLENVQSVLTKYEQIKKDLNDLLALISPDSAEMKAYMSEFEKAKVVADGLYKRAAEFEKCLSQTYEMQAEFEALSDLYDIYDQYEEGLWDILESLEETINENNQEIEYLKGLDANGDEYGTYLEKEISLLEEQINKIQKFVDEVQKRIDAMMASEEK